MTTTCTRQLLLTTRRALHDTRLNAATPLPITAHGPPPKAPLPSALQDEQRIARRKKHANLLSKSSQALSKGGSPLKKRFWKEVSVQEKPEGLQIYLDSRPVRGPSKQILSLPHSKPQLAYAIALEWDLLTSAQQALKQHLVPMTSLVARAEDVKIQETEAKAREDVTKSMMRYLDTDTLLCWAPESSASTTSTAVGETTQQDSSKEQSLRDLQRSAAQPIIAFLTTHIWHGAEINAVADSDSIVPAAQPQASRDIIRGWIASLPAYELAGLERAVLATKSLLVGARFLVEWSSYFDIPRRADVLSNPALNPFGVEQATHAASLEVRWQTDMWGEVEDTHDVDKEDLRRQLGSVALLVADERSGLP